MGMSASQARLLQLQARQSNLEYQGQQINQERTILSQQCTDLYNSLLGMTVPTPPSTQDYTKVQYTGTDGASTFTLGNIVPHGTNYSVEMKYQKTGHYMEEQGTAMITQIPSQIGMTNVPTPATTNYINSSNFTTISSDIEDDKYVLHKLNDNDNLDELANAQYVLYVKDDSGNFKRINPDFNDDSWKNDYKKSDIYVMWPACNNCNGESGVKNYSDGDLVFNGNGEPQEYTQGGFSKQALLEGNYFVYSADTAVRINASNIATYFDNKGTEANPCYVPKNGYSVGTKCEASSGNSYKNPDCTGNGDEYYVAGQKTYSLSQAKQDGKITEASYKSYIEAIKDAFPEYAEASNEKIEADFQVYFTKNSSGLNVPHFVLNADLRSGQVDSNNSKAVASYDYVANGTYTSTTLEDNCTLEFDTSGRITKIGIPSRDDNGNVIGYKTIELTASTVTDEAAYQDAYNKYEYAMYEYDKQQQEINAKTEIIQQEDRNLELKLQRLDNERQQITTEIEAVEKVIDDNIESSYKTFSG